MPSFTSLSAEELARFVQDMKAPLSPGELAAIDSACRRAFDRPFTGFRRKTATAQGNEQWATW